MYSSIATSGGSPPHIEIDISQDNNEHVSSSESPTKVTRKNATKRSEPFRNEEDFEGK
ncbi:hypothetical protein OROMI_013198 [Orobanche minor]